MNIVLLLLNFLVSSNHLPSDDLSKSREEVVKTIKNYSKKIQNEQGIILKLYGLSYAGEDKVYDGKIHKLDLAYDINQRHKYFQGRKLFYNIVDGIINEINQDLSLEKYFYHYPICYEDLKFSLSFEDGDKDILKRDDLYMISISRNQIMYFFVQEDGKGPETVIERSTAEFSVGYNKSNLRSIVRDLPEDPEAAKLDK